MSDVALDQLAAAAAVAATTVADAVAATVAAPSPRDASSDCSD